MQTDDAAKPAVSRRAVMTGAGAVAAAAALTAATGCSTYGQSPDAAPATGGGGTGGAAAGLAKTSEIPVGGGKVFKDQKVVVTQATAGKFAAFTAVCTHQSCIVNDVADGTINCTCHGTKYNLDGTVAKQPDTGRATTLPSKTATVTGDSISVT